MDNCLMSLHQLLLKNDNCYSRILSNPGSNESKSEQKKFIRFDLYHTTKVTKIACPRPWKGYVSFRWSYCLRPSRNQLQPFWKWLCSRFCDADYWVMRDRTNWQQTLFRIQHLRFVFPRFHEVASELLYRWWAMNCMWSPTILLRNRLIEERISDALLLELPNSNTGRTSSNDQLPTWVKFDTYGWVCETIKQDGLTKWIYITNQPYGFLTHFDELQVIRILSGLQRIPTISTVRDCIESALAWNYEWLVRNNKLFRWHKSEFHSLLVISWSFR
jgi:hypothetical protein